MYYRVMGILIGALVSIGYCYLYNVRFSKNNLGVHPARICIATGILSGICIGHYNDKKIVKQVK